VGPVSNIAITGRLELDELERWGWLLPGTSSPGFDFIGSLNNADQTLEIETRSSTASAACCFSVDSGAPAGLAGQLRHGAWLPLASRDRSRKKPDRAFHPRCWKGGHGGSWIFTRQRVSRAGAHR
jgi:hypothetical protein